MNRAHYYREANGDYLALFPAYVRHDSSGRRIFDGRATALGGLKTSVCTTGISDSYLRERCTRVRRRDVPRHWLTALVGQS